MDPALESLKEVIVLLRSSEIGNSGAILAKLPPSRFECDCFQIAADLPSLAQFGAVFKAVSKAPQCCRERRWVFKPALPQTTSAGLQPPESSRSSKGAAGKNRWLGSWAGDNCWAGRKDGKARGEQLKALARNSSNDWRYQGMAIGLRLQVERVNRWSQRRRGVSLGRRGESSSPGKAELGSTVEKLKHEISLGEENRNYSVWHCWQWDT